MKNIRRYFISLFFILIGLQMNSYCQSVGLNNANPDASSILDATATDRGVLVPRMTTANRNAITSPAKGLLVYDTDMDMFYYNSGTSGVPLWTPISSGWKNSTNRIKIIPRDFILTCKANKGKAQPNSWGYDNISGTNINNGIVISDDNVDLAATCVIPIGFKATKVKIYGNLSTVTFDVYEGDITTGTLSAVSGSANVNSEATLATPINSTDVNMVVIIIHLATKEVDKAYGGYVTIAPM